MEEKLLKIYKVKIRPELQAYSSLTESDIEDVVNELDATVRIAGEKLVFDNLERTEMLKYAKLEMGFGGVDHIQIRGGGFYRGEEETELNKEDWDYYIKHRNFISDHVFKGQPNVVESIDFETDQIIKKIPNPTKPENRTFLNKGLVIGYVQSGKTANFTHLISKAASIGYKFVIVLGGMTNTLRSQTQFRLDRELTGVNHYGLTDTKFVFWERGERKYRCHTGSPNEVQNYDGDFHIPVENFSDYFAQSNDVALAVIKKLARSGESFGSVLGRLIRWIENRHDLESEMPPVLIIDDEADQASIDSTQTEAEPTTINHAIRHLISLFPQVSYVGYTATPFANVFIDADAEFNGLPDLYPEDFIYSLPEPARYFGTKQFFGTHQMIGDEVNLVHIENVPDDEKTIINDPEEEETESIIQAFWDFVFSVIIRRFRGDKKHCGFMIHSDHRNIYHDSIRLKIASLLENKIDALELRDPQTKAEILLNWKRYIDKSNLIARVGGYSYEYPAFSSNEIIDETEAVLWKIDLRIVNGLYDNLDYNAEDLDVLIVVGGNLMSRGVTIEGLTISYYLRDSGNYDTLLQMGRWFGYRVGYEDLVRVYTTERIEEHFEYIMGVEDDLRREVNRYQEERLTPRDFAPRVRAHMHMMPSGKMGNSRRVLSYSKQSVQTIYLHRDLQTLQNNNLVVKNLLNQYPQDREKISGNYDIPLCSIDKLMEFLNNFITSNPRIAGFDKDDVVRYIRTRINSGEIRQFDLRIAGLKDQKPGSVVDDLGNIFEIFPSVRSARSGTGWNLERENLVNIGVISDSNDIPSGEDEAITRPLLIIYSIDKVNSNSFKQGKWKENVFETSEDIISGLDFNPKGFALVFPSSNVAEGEYDYYQQIFLS